MSAETEKRDWKEKAGRWLTRKREWMKVVYAVLKVHKYEKNRLEVSSLFFRCAESMRIWNTDPLDFDDGCTLWIEKEKLCAAPAGYGGEAANLQDFNMKSMWKFIK